MNSTSCILKQYIAWYALRIMHVKKDAEKSYGLVFLENHLYSEQCSYTLRLLYLQISNPNQIQHYSENHQISNSNQRLWARNFIMLQRSTTFNPCWQLYPLLKLAVLRKYAAWYEFNILDLETVYYLVQVVCCKNHAYQERRQEIIWLGILRKSSVFRTCTARRVELWKLGPSPPYLRLCCCSWLHWMHGSVGCKVECI